jgi:hypothetical protein
MAIVVVYDASVTVICINLAIGPNAEFYNTQLVRRLRTEDGKAVSLTAVPWQKGPRKPKKDT